MQTNEWQTALNSNPVLIGFFPPCHWRRRIVVPQLCFDRGRQRLRQLSVAVATRAETADAGTSDTRGSAAHCNCRVIQTAHRGARARSAAAPVSVCTHYLCDAVCYGLEQDQVGSDWRKRCVKKRTKEILKSFIVALEKMKLV